jgi:hypothetical protein
MHSSYLPYVNNNNSIQFVIYLRAELNRPCTITEPARIQKQQQKENTGQKEAISHYCLYLTLSI